MFKIDLKILKKLVNLDFDKVDNFQYKQKKPYLLLYYKHKATYF